MRIFIIAGLMSASMLLPRVTVADSLVNRVIVYEGNGNAYALFDVKYDKKGNYIKYNSVSAPVATKIAENSSYKGVPGRLAIIDSKELDSYLRTTFRPSANAWIGLRYTCASKTWTYSNGEKVPVNAYTHWHPVNWNPSRGNTLSCSNLFPFLQAYIAGGESAPYWVLRDSIKFWEQFFVEYPLSEVEATEDAPTEPEAAAETAVEPEPETPPAEPSEPPSPDGPAESASDE